MRIYLVTADPVAAGGGKAVRLEILRRELRRRGHVVDVVEPTIPRYVEISARAALKGLAVISKGLATALALSFSVAKVARSIWRDLGRHQRGDPVIVDCQDWISAAAALKIRQRHHGRLVVVVTNHTATTAVQEMVLNGQLRSSSRLFRLVARKEQEVLCRADAVVFVNHLGRKKAQSAWSIPRAVTIHGGVDLPSPSPKAIAKISGLLRQFFPPGLLTVSCVTGLRPVKGVDLLLRALSVLKAKGHWVACVIAGDGAQRDDLAMLCKSLGVLDTVLFAGKLSRQEVGALLSLTDIYVQPSRDEGHPLAVIEAMAAGRPVVAFRVGGVPEVVTDGVTGLLAMPGNVEELAAKIQLLLGDVTLRQRLGAAAQQAYLTRFTTKRMVDEYEEFYERLEKQARRQ